jgi:hypothetical protein
MGLPARWPVTCPVVINRNAPAAARVRRFRGAKWGANAGRRQATPGDSQPWFVQLDGPSGHVQQYAATLRMRLKAEGRRFDPAPDHQFCSVIIEFGELRGAKVTNSYPVESHAAAFSKGAIHSGHEGCGCRDEHHERPEGGPHGACTRDDRFATQSENLGRWSERLDRDTCRIGVVENPFASTNGWHADHPRPPALGFACVAPHGRRPRSLLPGFGGPGECPVDQTVVQAVGAGSGVTADRLGWWRSRCRRRGPR